MLKRKGNRSGWRVTNYRDRSNSISGAAPPRRRPPASKTAHRTHPSFQPKQGAVRDKNALPQQTRIWVRIRWGSVPLSRGTCQICETFVSRSLATASGCSTTCPCIGCTDCVGRNSSNRKNRRSGDPVEDGPRLQTRRGSQPRPTSAHFVRFGHTVFALNGYRHKTAPLKKSFSRSPVRRSPNIHLH